MVSDLLSSYQETCCNNNCFQFPSALSKMLWFFFVSCLVGLSLGEEAETNTLYYPEDAVHILNDTNFDEKVFVLHRDTAWFIQFYNVWCGHCIRFSPTFKEFAREINNWDQVVNVGVVNCADKLNTNICRRYEVAAFPTMKQLWVGAERSDPGKEVSGDRDIISLENNIVNFLESEWDSKIVPKNWPDITPVQSSNLNDVIGNNGAVYFLVEQPESTLGKKVILDFSREKNIVLRRVLTTNQELVNNLEAKIDSDSLLTVIKAELNGNKDMLFDFKKASNESVIRDQIYEKLLHRTRVVVVEPEITTTTTSPPVTGDNIIPVNLVDLENAVHYSLSQEVGMANSIDGEKYSALKNYLFILKNNFPGTQQMTNYLTAIYNRISNKKHSITGEDFLKIMEEVKSEQGFSTSLKEWVTCKGSTTKYRGYPCSLWTLFHTLSVQADTHGRDAVPVLFSVRDYVSNFFSCQECKRHFMQMAKSMPDEVFQSRQAVLWLWRAHNKVNLRLHGDPTEDPQHPKIQFPPKRLCDECVSETVGNDIKWDDEKVMNFLKDFYTTIVMPEEASAVSTV